MIGDRDESSSEIEPRGTEVRQAWHTPKLRHLRAIEAELNGGGHFDGVCFS
jgi:hypothetical protein